MNKSGKICLAFMTFIGAITFLLPAGAALLSVTLAGLFSFGYFIYYIIYRDLHHDIIGSIVLAFLVMALVAIPIVGWLILLAFVFYNIAKALEGLKSLLPDVVTSGIIYMLLGASTALNSKDTGVLILLAVLYMAVTVFYCRQLSQLPTREALFKMSIMWLSIPFAALMIISIVSSLANLFKAISSTISRSVLTPQTVSAHMRAGVPVGEYTRNITSTVSSTVTHITPGSGALTSAVTKEIAQKITPPKE
jgi:hypothetical protein